MTRLTKVLFTTALSVAAMAGTALADDPPAGGDGGGGDASGGGDAAAGGGGDATAAPPADASADAPAAEGEINASYGNAKGKVTVGADLLIVKLSFSDGMGNSASFTQEQIGVGAAYGVTDKITAGGSYVFPIAGDGTDENKGKGTFSVGGMFSLADSAKMHVAASADFSVDMCGKIGMDGSCGVGDKAIHAGLGLRYLVAPKIAVFTGAPYGPQFLQGLPGQHLSISLESKGPINFDVPVGAALQAMPKLLAYVSLNLAHFRLTNKGDADTVSPIGSDAEKGGLGVPLTVGGLFSVTPQIDVGANIIFPDVLHAGDLYGIALGGRYNM